jgi:hypothetical protein
MSKSNPRLGYHYYPDDGHFGRPDLETWLPILQSLGARWLTLRASLSNAVPAFLIQGLKNAGIEPVIHIPCKLGEINTQDLAPPMREYAKSGARFVVVYDRPNLKSSWKPTAWARHGLVERFLDCVLPVLETAHQAGLSPVLPPLEPGGDYWDTAFLEAALIGLARRSKRNLLHQLTLGTYLWTFEKPLDWGQGGPDRWPEALPYSTPPGSQDHRGLHLFDWYAALSAKVVGSPLPMLVMAGGAVPSPEQIQPSDLEQHAEQNLAIARMLENDQIPPTVLNMAFYLLACENNHADAHAAWFPEQSEPRPVVAAMQAYVAPAAKQSVPSSKKPFDHYLLLPDAKTPGFQQQLLALADFIVALRPMIGFSLQEARHAREVTLAGNEKALPQTIEDELRSAGCFVRRMPFVSDDSVVPLAKGLAGSPNNHSPIFHTGAFHG